MQGHHRKYVLCHDITDKAPWKITIKSLNTPWKVLKFFIFTSVGTLCEAITELIFFWSFCYQQETVVPNWPWNFGDYLQNRISGSVRRWPVGNAVHDWVQFFWKKVHSIPGRTTHPGNLSFRYTFQWLRLFFTLSSS